MDKGKLITNLGEAFRLPNAIINGFIDWQEMDHQHVKVTITYEGLTVSLIFKFDKHGLVQTFSTSERPCITLDGKIIHIDWSAHYQNYAKQKDLILLTRFQAIWHYDDGTLFILMIAMLI
ncbi:DUF6544 family protein [Virgibacillus pantothenticus]|uniref:DUF6544 family protein n=1 Tax=Virgibacillus pantothenticus TaxID=1473 RepID=UPI001BAFF176|nr:DUF6544 family protein [Virgibacillus pantothenticus]